MKRLLVNIALFLVAVLLLSSAGIYGLIYSLIFSLLNLKKYSFIDFCADTIYSINIGIDQIGNVLLALFLTRYCLIDKTFFPFGKVDQTISHVLAVNYFRFNLSSFGLWLVKTLDFFDKDHMYKSL